MVGEGHSENLPIPTAFDGLFPRYFINKHYDFLLDQFN